MIRSDGVVKLMDFGISHMVDLERLTVTGQLLGSPAYMAPEHVEGRPLDFRTDVFAVGIVLYQLTVGKLPFEGKNPHEVLKRIAECKFIDPRQANPRIGNRLGRIILRAMAARAGDRYPGDQRDGARARGVPRESRASPTDKIAGELARYFKAPVAYEQALKERLVDHLTRRGQKLLAERRSGRRARRVRSRADDRSEEREGPRDPRRHQPPRAHEDRRASRSARSRVIGGGAYMIHRSRSLPPAAPADGRRDRAAAHRRGRRTQVAHELAMAPPDRRRDRGAAGRCGDAGDRRDRRRAATRRRRRRCEAAAPRRTDVRSSWRESGSQLRHRRTARGAAWPAMASSSRDVTAPIDDRRCATAAA